MSLGRDCPVKAGVGVDVDAHSSTGSRGSTGNRVALRCVTSGCGSAQPSSAQLDSSRLGVFLVVACFTGRAES